MSGRTEVAALLRWVIKLAFAAQLVIVPWNIAPQAGSWRSLTPKPEIWYTPVWSRPGPLASISVGRLAVRLGITVVLAALLLRVAPTQPNNTQ